MAEIIESLGTLETLNVEAWPRNLSRHSVPLSSYRSFEYAELYRLQPNIRTCVDFLSRNVAQLGLHVFRRVDETDRIRLYDHPLATLLKQPYGPKQKVTGYRFIEMLMGDLGIYFNAFWFKVRKGGEIVGLIRVPPPTIEVEGVITPTYWNVAGGKRVKLNPDDVVHFHGYNPVKATEGLSPLETLRRVLAEEYASGVYREHFWQNAARMQGIISRPVDAPEWSPEARDRFMVQFAEAYTGEESSGRTAVLEDGMEWSPVSFNARDSEYLAGRRLTREECARAYHIPLTMIGILDNATLTNIREQHQNLYQDALGPWLTMIEQDIELQILPEMPDNERVYIEFNIHEKLKGDFEEQTKSLQSSVGRPWMTADEARARMNLPAMGGDAAELVTPLNVLVGGQASPRDSAPPVVPGQASVSLPDTRRKAINTHWPDLRTEHERMWERGLAKHYTRQRDAILGRVTPSLMEISGNGKSDIGGIWWDEDRWDRELTADLLRLNRATALAWAGRIAGEFGAEVDEGVMQAWLQEHSQVQASYINTQVREEVSAALLQPESHSLIKDLFVAAVGVWAIQQAVTAVTGASNFGAHEGARAARVRSKMWRVNSNNPRSAHEQMNGEQVNLGEVFSNGMRWPGDPSGGAENNANCMCSLEFSQ